MLTNIYSSWIGVKALCNYKQIFVECFCNFSICSGFNPLIMIFLQYAITNSTCILFMSQGFTSLHVPVNISTNLILFKFFSIKLSSSSNNDLQVKLCQHNTIQSTTTAEDVSYLCWSQEHHYHRVESGWFLC